MEETDNMLSDLLGMQEDHVDDLAAAPAAAMPAGVDSSLLDLLGGPAPVAGACACPRPQCPLTRSRSKALRRGLFGNSWAF